MTILMVPPLDEEPWPTLGPFVCAFIEENLCHGPGDLLGQAVKLTDEQRAWIYRMYEVEPPEIVTRKGGRSSRARNTNAGRRRFQRCALSLRKGSAKTEFAAWIAAAELHQEGPVRCAGFRTIRGILQPDARPVTDPYIPMISYTEEQTEELAYGALRRILEESSIASDFDIGLDRIMRLGGDGKAEAVSASPNARDGARTTFQHADETHRFTLESLCRAWTVMLANLAKRPIADPWALETTTAPEPGAGSVAESTMEYAKGLEASGRPSRLFFFHRQASDKHNLETETGIRAAVIEASGKSIGKWTAVDRIVEDFLAPDADRSYLERVWLNRPTQAASVAFDIEAWRALVRVGYHVEEGAAIALGFDGSRFDDSTALVATELYTGHQWKLGVWSMPETAKLETGASWEVPVEEVDAAVHDAFERFNVVRMYCDPPKWESWVAKWASDFGDKRVVEWWTNRRRPMAYALRSFVNAIAAEDMSHDGDKELEAHLANSRRLYTNLLDEEAKRLWILRKERSDSPKKIDAAMAAVLSWEARNDALSGGKGSGEWGFVGFSTEHSGGKR